MATSGVCVTGLTVFNIGTELSTFGHWVLLGLIQIGGLGYMLLATLTTIMAGRLALSQRLLVRESFQVFSFDHITSFVKYVLKVTLILEAMGAIILMFLWQSDVGWSQALFYGIFHSISAFCNAGFSLFSESLFGSSNRTWILLTFIFSDHRRRYWFYCS